MEGRRLILGGVEIPYEKGLDGHSDADVLIHALMDALAGGCGAGRHRKSISRTPTMQYRGISSMALLERVGEHARRELRIP